uniref:N-acetyltransferase domain-containing protein n=1 Tax=Nelumbo nucifera TaxID=4432 RepID=A0A822Z5U0_NELNU|nr:TPA_asm: hypothetical protein HUJ06_013364 [Nelumbo nucifera]
MAHLKACPNNLLLPKRLSRNSACSSIRVKCDMIQLVNLEGSCKNAGCYVKRDEKGRKLWSRRRGVLVPCCSSTSKELVGEGWNGKSEISKDAYLISEFGWRVRRLVEKEDEMRMVAQIQSEAFHIPVALFDDLFFEFFRAEVLSGLVYKIRNSPPDRYACLVAEPMDASYTEPTSEQVLVGVVDVTALRDAVVLRHLEGAEEYLYMSGIAVLKDFRRRKVATVLLKACDLLALLWGFDYLALRAYEDDFGACKLYEDAALNSMRLVLRTYKSRTLQREECH